MYLKPKKKITKNGNFYAKSILDIGVILKLITVET